MLIITIEKKDANTGVRETLHKLIITNDGTGTAEIGNYDVTLYRGDARPQAKFRVLDHDRLRRVALWRLLLRVVQGVEGVLWAREENKEPGL